MAAALDLVALGQAATRCERGILATVESVRSHGHGSAEHAEAVEASRRFLQTRQAYLACSALSPEAREGKVAFTLDGSAVWIVGVTTFDAADFGRALIGEVGGFIVAGVGALADAIAEPA